MAKHRKSNKKTSRKLQVTTYLAAGVLVSGGGAAVLTGALSAPAGPAPIAASTAEVRMTGLFDFLGSIVSVLISNGSSSTTGNGGNGGTGGTGGGLLSNGGDRWQRRQRRRWRRGRCKRHGRRWWHRHRWHRQLERYPRLTPLQ
jgi:hypothetical protein